MTFLKKCMDIFRFLFVILGISWKDKKFRKDITRWKDICRIDEKDWIAVAMLLSRYPEFRNVVIYRHRHKRIFRTWLAIVYKPMDTLYIMASDIGGGLFIQHGFSTMIAAKSIGENCWINQQVTIGYTDTSDPPVIGNNVIITSGAKVLGNIHVGDNVTVGANAVVVRDVEANTVVGGVPARILKYKTVQEDIDE